MLYPREGFNIPRWFASQLSRRQTLQKLTIQQNRQPALSVSHCRICRENNTACYSPAKPCNTVHSDAAARFLSKLGVEQLEPVVHNLGGRRGTIIEGPVLETTKRKTVWSVCTLERINIKYEKASTDVHVCQHLPQPGSLPSLLEPYHR